MEELIEYLASNLHECPVAVLENAHFQFKEGPLFSQAMTLTPTGSLYEAVWDDKIGLKIVGDCITQDDQTVDVRSTGDKGLIQARIGDKGVWKDVVFQGLSNGVLQWLLSTSPKGIEMCQSHDLDHNLADLCGDDIPFPISTHNLIEQRLHFQKPSGIRGNVNEIPTNDETRKETPPVAILDKTSGSRKDGFVGWKMWISILSLLTILILTAVVVWYIRSGSRITPKETRDSVPTRRELIDLKSKLVQTRTPRWEDGPMISL